jgi:hypothetical protein
MRRVRGALPADWRATAVTRDDFDRFLFAPEDVIVAIGQDGLVANVAKYLNGQPVLGVNPDKGLYDGVLVPLSPERAVALLVPASHGAVHFQRRTMAEAILDDGQKLLALNEIFVGHKSHQSARYEIEFAGKLEFQSSSGLIVSSGTGATGWARSIMESVHEAIPLKPEEPALAYFVREPFPSVSTGTSMRFGKIPKGGSLHVTSRLNEGGVIFADGIEQDRLVFDWGRRINIEVSARSLNLVLP